MFPGKCLRFPSVPIPPHWSQEFPWSPTWSHAVPSLMLSLLWQWPLLNILLKTYPHGHRPHLPATHDYYTQKTWDSWLSPRQRISRSVNLEKGGIKMSTNFVSPCIMNPLLFSKSRNGPRWRLDGNLLLILPVMSLAVCQNPSTLYLFMNYKSFVNYYFL